MSLYEEGLVSIITPNYNCEKFIVETIESVINQTYTKWEMIIVDDCSTDNSITIAMNYKNKDDRIKVIKNEHNMGAALSRNKAIEIAKGEYIAFLDSDDVWLEKKLETQIKFMKDNNSDFSYTNYLLITEDGKSLRKETRVIEKLNYEKYLFHCFTGCLTVCYNQKEIGKIFGPNIKNNNDYGLFLEIIKKANNAMGIRDLLAKYRIRINSLSRFKLHKLKPYVILMRKYNNLSILKTFFYLITNILIKAFWKYKKTAN